MIAYLCPPVLAAHCPVCARPFNSHWSYPLLETWDPVRLRHVEGDRFARTNRPRRYCSRDCARKARNTHGRDVRAYDRQWATVLEMQEMEDAGQLAIPGAAALPEPPPRPSRKAS